MSLIHIHNANKSRLRWLYSLFMFYPCYTVCTHISKNPSPPKDGPALHKAAITHPSESPGPLSGMYIVDCALCFPYMCSFRVSHVLRPVCGRDTAPGNVTLEGRTHFTLIMKTLTTKDSEIVFFPSSVYQLIRTLLGLQFNKSNENCKDRVLLNLERMLKIINKPAGGWISQVSWALQDPKLSCNPPWPNRPVKANAALIQSHLQLGLLGWRSSEARGTGNPPATGWI